MIHWNASKSTSVLRPMAMPLARILAVLGLFSAVTAPPVLPRLFFLRQDAVVLVGLVALLLLFSLRRLQPPLGAPLAGAVLSKRTVAAGAVVFALALWAGTYLLLGNYPLTRDEQMAVFDMQVFLSGHLAAPIAPAWRMYVEALTPAFVLPLPGNAAWASAYMPMNAMLRAAFATVLDPALMNPVLAAVGAIALFDVAERLFPQCRSAQAIALLLYATSAQILSTAMMSYAMTAHLALNLVWLALYLRGTRFTHAMAIGVGFVAIGLHQIVFHPLFALPFIDHLRRQGQWRTALVYLGCYALFGLFWISYPHLVALSAGLTPQAGTSAGSSGYVSQRVLPLLLHHEPQTIQLMVANLLRFVTWENLALLPLMALGVAAVRRNEGIARPLAYGILLTIAAMAFLLPYQGHGWGYRYLHGLIGNCALLAAYGWRDYSAKDEVRGFVRMATLATVFGSLPFLLWQTSTFVKPYARVNRMIDGIDADMVVIESEGPDFTIDEVRNRPDLTNRPIRLASNLLSPADIRSLCSRGTVAFVTGQEMRGFGIRYEAANESHLLELRDSIAGRRCTARS